jgi:hypothetical protein
MNFDGVRFKWSPHLVSVSGSDVSWLDDIETQVIEAISLDLDLTIGGVTAPLAYWINPEHWSTDWAETLGREGEADFDATAEVEELFDAGRREAKEVAKRHERERAEKEASGGS